MRDEAHRAFFRTVERVLAGGGEVSFYDEGTLDRHQRIAAVLRY